MAKSYNPFKMVGSWIGMGVGAIPSTLIAIIRYKQNVNCAKLALENPGFACAVAPWQVSIPGIFIGAIIGFLIGYGIHSWIGKARG